MIPQEAILEDQASKVISCSLDFGSNLCELVYVRPQAFLLSLDNPDQSGLSHWSFLPRCEACRESLRKVSLGCNTPIRKAF